MEEKNPRWKQPTPAMQLIAIMGNLQGFKYLLEEKEITVERWLEVSMPIIDEISSLTPFIEKGTW